MSDERGTVVDFAVHLHPRDLGVEPPPGAQLVGEGRVGSAERQLEELTAAGIDAAVQSQPLFMSASDAAATRRANDLLLAEIDACDAFYGLASLPVGAGGIVAATEFDRCLAAGFNGGAVTTGRDSVGLDAPELDPVYDVAERWDAPVFVHVPPRIDTPYASDVVLRREHALAESIYAVIQGGVFDRHPDLALVYHHYGGNLAGMLGHVDLHLDADRWPGRESLTSAAEFRRHLATNVYVDTAGFLGASAPLRTALEAFPVEHVLFGSDFPWEPRTPAEHRSMVRTVRETTPDPDARKILGENALALLANVD